MTSDRGPASQNEPAVSETDQRPLIDERVALRAAGVAAPHRQAQPSEVAALRAEIQRDLPQIDAAARQWSQLGPELAPVRVAVVGRTGWVRANLAALRGTFEPLRERLERRTVAKRLLSVQVGALFGLLSAKVLGQYILPFGGPGGGQLVIVGPNVLELAERHGNLAEDIRRAVLLHEVTHRLQFDATPWLGPHLRDLVDRYVANMRERPMTLGELAPKLPEVIEQVRRTGTIEPVLGAVLTEPQREIIDEAQGLMSLLEGHGNTAMFDAAPRTLIRDPEGVRAALANRSQDVTTKVLTAVAGLEMKRQQYRQGEAFVREVLELGGIEGLNQAFGEPDNLPRGDEVTDAAAWFDRVRGG